MAGQARPTGEQIHEHHEADGGDGQAPCWACVEPVGNPWQRGHGEVDPSRDGGWAERSSRLAEKETCHRETRPGGRLATVPLLAVLGYRPMLARRAKRESARRTAGNRLCRLGESNRDYRAKSVCSGLLARTHRRRSACGDGAARIVRGFSNHWLRGCRRSRQEATATLDLCFVSAREALAVVS